MNRQCIQSIEEESKKKDQDKKKKITSSMFDKIKSRIVKRQKAINSLSDTDDFFDSSP